MSYASWHVGMKVVCVIANTATLQKGAVYTIRALDSEFVYLEEPSTFGVGGPDLAGYLYVRFRPVQKRPTDISVFTAMLHGEHAPEQVTA